MKYEYLIVICIISIIVNIIFLIKWIKQESKIKEVKFYYPTGEDLDEQYIEMYNELILRNDIKLVSIKANHCYAYGQHNLVVRYIPLKDNAIVKGKRWKKY